MTKKIPVGKVSTVFGVKGQVKVISFCEDPLQIENYQLYDKKGNPLRLTISNKNKTIVGTSSGNAILIASIEGIVNRNEAEKFRGKELFVNREDFNETDDDEFYYVDLIDLDVLDETSKKIGKVINVQDFGAGGMLEIEFEDEYKKSVPDKKLGKIECFPFKDEIFPQVDLNKGFVQMNTPDMNIAKEL